MSAKSDPPVDGTFDETLRYFKFYFPLFGVGSVLSKKS